MKTSMKKKNIALVCGGLGPESEISHTSAEAVAKALDQLNYNYFLAPADNNLFSLLISKKPDLVFLAVHGIYGEDGLIQSLCEYLKIPYTGSGVLASSLCMDKIFLKEFLLKHKIPTPDFHIVDSDWSPKKISSYPVIVKSSHGGSSIGTSIVKEEKDLFPAIEKAKQIGAQVFVEDYLANCKEIAVSILDKQILTPIEIKPKGDFYDYKRKYIKGESSYFIPPQVDPFVIEKIKLLSQSIFQTVAVRSYARADFLLEDGKTPWLLEVNTLPGLTEQSLLPKSAQYDNIEFPQLIEKIIQLATTDYKF